MRQKTFEKSLDPISDFASSLVEISGGVFLKLLPVQLGVVHGAMTTVGAGMGS